MGETLARIADEAYGRVVRPLMFLTRPDTAHALTIRALSLLDSLPAVARALQPRFDASEALITGGVQLPGPVMVAAGLVKGHGFDDENRAVEAAHHANIIPGWRTIPMLCGPVEIGSFTRFPRIGNPPPVLWRDVATRSTQNRIGLRNPGARAASVFLSTNRPAGPFGLSIATTPGESDPVKQSQHVSESIGLFLERGVVPAWFTINLSCPNTEDDPQSNQTEQLARQVSEAAVAAAGDVPVWVKIGPDLSDPQYQTLVDTFDATGVKAVVATNTLAAPVAQTQLSGGFGGGRLFERALAVVGRLRALRERREYKFDIIGCGGVMDGRSLRSYTDAGAKAVQVWSALVYRGPFAPTRIGREAMVDTGGEQIV
ncbi:MAG: hypothetical protein IPK52_05855 [Chloroflexi bacterium]|nr:hypothetical protein [Chloroflexota bacterium]